MKEKYLSEITQKIKDEKTRNEEVFNNLNELPHIDETLKTIHSIKESQPINVKDPSKPTWKRAVVLGILTIIITGIVVYFTGGIKFA